MTEVARRRPGRFGRPRRPRWRGRLISLLVLLVLMTVWGGICWQLVGHPRVDAPRPADAVIVLGPPDANGRIDLAYRLIDAGYAKTLVVSVMSEAQRAGKHACNGGLPGTDVICFRPSPATTQGEAREIRTLARERGWKSVIVVTSTYHVSRARMIVERCFSGQVFMVPADQHIRPLDWAREFGYQSGAYVKAELFTRGC